MTQLTIDMSVVAECTVTDCAFNVNRNCHAKAITVGSSSVHPGCDTFYKVPNHTRDANRTAGVGACKVTACRYNHDFECTAGNVSVGKLENDPVCLTFSPA